MQWKVYHLASERLECSKHLFLTVQEHKRFKKQVWECLLQGVCKKEQGIGKREQEKEANHKRHKSRIVTVERSLFHHTIPLNNCKIQQTTISYLKNFLLA
jgi:hypothetical protein